MQCIDLPAQQLNFGSIDKPLWKSVTGIPQLNFLTNPEHLSINTLLDGTPQLRQRLIPNEQGSPRVVSSSAVPSARTYFVTQSVYLEPGFDWGGSREGGKLGFGLAGGSSPTGAARDTDGFTARFGWRGNGDGTARITVYSYAADRTQNYPFGDDYVLQGYSAPVGEWFDLSMEVTLNSTENLNDGSVRAWANDALLLNRRNIQWQSSGGTPAIDNLFYATFYGGNDPSWSPDQTTYVRFRDVCWAPVTSSEDDAGIYRLASEWENGRSWLGRHSMSDGNGGVIPTKQVGFFPLNETNLNWGSLKWTIENAPGNTVRIRNGWNPQSGYLSRDSAFDRPGWPNATGIGVLPENDGSIRQLWLLEQIDNDRYRIKSADDSQGATYLTRDGLRINDRTYVPGSTVNLYDSKSWASQMWELRKITPTEREMATLVGR